ncbi:DnaJ domain-containing protein [Spirosoma aerophilum]
MRDYYYILGIEQIATEQEIKNAFRKLSLKFHPDRNSDDEYYVERFRQVKEAYETLSVAHKRVTYDVKLNDFNIGVRNVDWVRKYEEQLKKKHEKEFLKKENELQQKYQELMKTMFEDVQKATAEHIQKKKTEQQLLLKELQITKNILNQKTNAAMRLQLEIDALKIRINELTESLNSFNF